MNPKLIAYLIVIPVVMYAMDSLNINSFFKKNKVLQARILYIMIALVFTYLMVAFIFDFISVSKII